MHHVSKLIELSADLKLCAASSRLPQALRTRLLASQDYLLKDLVPLIEQEQSRRRHSRFWESSDFAQRAEKTREKMSLAAKARWKKRGPRQLKLTWEVSKEIKIVDGFVAAAKLLELSPNSVATRLSMGRGSFKKKLAGLRPGSPARDSVLVERYDSPAKGGPSK